MLNQFDTLLTQLSQALPLFPVGNDTHVAGPYCGRVENGDQDSILFFGKPDEKESVALNIKVDSNSGLVTAVSKVCVFTDGIEEVVYKYNGRLFFRSIVLVNNKTSIQFHWSVETGQLETVSISCLLRTTVYEFIGIVEKVSAFGGIITDVPAELKGQTEILGIPIVWKKDDVQKCAESVLKIGFLMTKDLIDQMSI